MARIALMVGCGALALRAPSASVAEQQPIIAGSLLVYAALMLGVTSLERSARALDSGSDGGSSA